MLDGRLVRGLEDDHTLGEGSPSAVAISSPRVRNLPPCSFTVGGVRAVYFR